MNSVLPREKPLPRSNEERSATTRRQLLDAAVRCLVRDGYANVTQAMIAAEARVTRGAVQYHFRTPDDLMLELVVDLGQQMMAACEVPAELLKHQLSERVGMIIDANWTLLQSAEFLATLHIWMASRPNEKLFEQVSTGVQRVERRLDDAWAFLFSDTGVTREDIAVIRHLVFSALKGLILREISARTRPSTDAEIAMLKRWVVTAMRRAG